MHDIGRFEQLNFYRTLMTYNLSIMAIWDTMCFKHRVPEHFSTPEQLALCMQLKIITKDM